MPDHQHLCIQLSYKTMHRISITIKWRICIWRNLTTVWICIKISSLMHKRRNRILEKNIRKMWMGWCLPWKRIKLEGAKDLKIEFIDKNRDSIDLLTLIKLKTKRLTITSTILNSAIPSKLHDNKWKKLTSNHKPWISHRSIIIQHILEGISLQIKLAQLQMNKLMIQNSCQCTIGA